MKTETAQRIQAFTVNVPDATISDLHRRLSNTRWMIPIKPGGWEHGVDPVYLKEFISYWEKTFDWRAQEEKLNRFKHFLAEVEDYNIHFIHEKGKGPIRIPILLLHGWPDSFYRFNKIIPMLTDPASIGSNHAVSFDVVVPSLPGFGFTQTPREISRQQPMLHSASLMFTLMTEVLGYSQFVVAGGDGGSPISPDDGDPLPRGGKSNLHHRSRLAYPKRRSVNPQ
jgi:hypothetical protein